MLPSNVRARRLTSGGGWRHVPALLVALVFLVPLVFMVSGSLRGGGLPPPRTPELIPSEPTLDNYGRAFDLVDLARYTFNSALVVAIAVPLTLLFASWAGFAMARLPRRAAGWLVALSLVSLMVPLTALLVPRFAIFSWLGLTNTYVPLIAPALIGTSPFYVLLFYWAFRRIPAELYEACRLEGLSPFTSGGASGSRSFARWWSPSPSWRPSSRGATSSIR